MIKINEVFVSLALLTAQISSPSISVPQNTQKLALLRAFNPFPDIVEIQEYTPKNKAILAKLSFCESGNNPNAINPNDNGSPSFGKFQWKIDSFFYYNNIYKILPDLEKAEVRNIIMDERIQTQLTDLVLQEPNGYKNWYNCFTKIK